MSKERKGTRHALSLVLETEMDARGLEDENRELGKQIHALQVSKQLNVSVCVCPKD